MTALHDLSAEALSKAYRTGELSPVEVTRACLARIDAWEGKLNAMYIVTAEAALAQAAAAEARWRAGMPFSALDGVPITIKDNIAVAGLPAPLGTAGRRHEPVRAGCPAGRARARGRLRVSRQDDDAGLRDARLRRVEPSRRHPQSVEPRAQSRRLELRRRRRNGGRLRAARARHRHRRIGAAARGLQRRVRAQAEPRPGADLAALPRPRGRTDHPHGRRRRADDGGAGAAGRARFHVVAGREDRMGLARCRRRRRAARPRARHRGRHQAAAGGARRGRGRGQSVRARRRDRRAGRPVHDAGDDGGARPLLPGAAVGRAGAARAGPARERFCRSSSRGAGGRKSSPPPTRRAASPSSCRSARRRWRRPRPTTF